jgi:hypothetical protein
MSEPAKRYYKTFSDNMHLQSENARLKAEVERLTKTGDAIISFLWIENDDDNCNGGITYIAEKAESDWNDAKEGKRQS